MARHGAATGGGQAITALVRELALQSQLVARDGAHWLLRVERESLNQPTARDACAPRWRLRATPRRSAWKWAASSTARPPQRSRCCRAPARLAEETVMNDPMCRR